MVTKKTESRKLTIEGFGREINIEHNKYQKDVLIEDENYHGTQHI